MRPYFKTLCAITTLLAAGSYGCVGDNVDFGNPNSSSGETSSASSGQGGSSSGQGGASSGQGGSSSGQGGSSSGQGGAPASCGDGMLQDDEACDGDDLGGASCQDHGYGQAAGLSCKDDCSVNTEGCTASCDGQLREPGEACDGNDLGTASCTDHGFVNPAGLGCNKDCSINAEGCTPTCGNSVTEPGEACDDGNLEPADGCNPSCQLPTGTSCNDAVGVSLGSTPVTITGTTVGGGMHDSTQCSNAGTSPDRVYAVTASSDGFLSASLTRPTTDYDAQLYALDSCGDSSSGIWCADAWDPNDTNATGGEVLSLSVMQGQTVYVVVDGYDGDAGNFELNLDLSVGNCSDPVPISLWAGVDMHMLGSNTNQANVHGTWGCGGNSSGEVIYQVTPQFSGNLEGALPANSSNYSRVLSARSTCLSLNTQLACDYDTMTGDAVIEHAVTQGTPYYYIVDGYSGSEGYYRLRLSPE